MVYVTLSFFLLPLLFLRKKTLSSKHNTDLVFRFPFYLGALVLSITATVPILSLIGYERSAEEQSEILVGDMLIFAGFYLLGLFVGVYLNQKAIILTSRSIYKKSIFGTRVFNLTEVSKIVIDHSAGNPIAAQAFLYSYGEKMVLEGFLTDYQDLIWKLRYQLCKNAAIVEKNV